MSTPLYLKIGRPKKIKIYRLLNTLLYLFFPLMIIIVLYKDNHSFIMNLCLILLALLVIASIIKQSINFETIGNIIIYDNSLIIKEYESIYEYKFQDISKIIFTFYLPEDYISIRGIFNNKGFQNKIKIITNNEIEHYIYCTYDFYKKIRTFRKEHNYKIRIWFSLSI